ncbi:MAG: hypothetical protein MUC43_08865 [Pirellula sp.]|nr:hypothetical protein [Pirellula sp.]
MFEDFNADEPEPHINNLLEALDQLSAAAIQVLRQCTKIEFNIDYDCSVAKAALTNPYSPPEMRNHIAAKSMVSTINGLLIGLGVGLLTCDFLDLSPSDYTPLYGWRNGVIFFGLLGTAVGYTRSDLLAWRWLILLGFVNLSIGSTVGFTTFAESPINIYTATMISAGFCYMLLGTLVAIRYRRA